MKLLFLSLNLGGTFVKYWDESATVAVRPRLQSCNIEEPLPTQTLPAPAKEKEKKKKAKGDDFLNCISTCLEGRYFSRRCL